MTPAEALRAKLGFGESLSADLISQPEAETPKTVEGAYTAHQVESIAKASLDFLGALAMPLVFKYFFPAVFKEIWSLLVTFVAKTRDFSQLAIGLPRGFGKTMLIKLFILYCVLFTKKQFILYIGGTFPKAVNVLTDVMGMLNVLNIVRVFGNWRLGEETDRQDLKKFGFRGRNIIIMAAGAGTDIRGITLENIRPDIMIFDDIQTRADADSETISNALETWMIGTAMKAKSPEGCLFVFIANMYPTKWSILRRLKTNPTWIKFICGGITANGESLWEELQPLTQLLKEYENDLAMGRPEIFFAEVLNDETASVNNLIDLSKLPVYPYREDEPYVGQFIIIDPSSGKVNSDAVSVMRFKIFDTTPVCVELKEGRMSPGETIICALTMALQSGARVVGIESNAYQFTLNYWFQFVCIQRGIQGIEAVELYSGTYSKNSRILNMFKELLASEIFFHPSCAAAINLQITQFNPLKRDNTDGLLDCLTYAPKMIEMYGNLITASNTIEEQEFASTRVRGVLESSCF